MQTGLPGAACCAWSTHQPHFPQPGFVGALDGLRPTTWGASVNYRASKGSELQFLYTQARLGEGVLPLVLQHTHAMGRGPTPYCAVMPLLLAGALPAPVLLREVLDTEETYAGAVARLKADKILSEFYFIVGVLPMATIGATALPVRFSTPSPTCTDACSWNSTWGGSCDHPRLECDRW